MENFFFYLGKVSILLTVFFLAYYILLRKETFFNSNRWFLLAGILTSLVLPLFIFTKIIWIEPTPITATPFNVIPAATESTTSSVVVEKKDFPMNWFYLAGGIYSMVVLFLIGKLIRDFWALKKIIHRKNIENLGKFKLVNSDKIQAPFSFFRYIVLNPRQFQKEELENILEHEKVHSSQFHSADMIFGQFLCIAFWFNPLAWLYKKAITQNLEFIADSTALKTVSDRIVYQKTLLKVSAPHHCIPITNHFYQSLIKKRIVMLNKNQSKKRNSWKYAIVLPLLAIFMLQFQVKTVAQVKNATGSKSFPEEVEIIIDKNSSDAYLKEQEKNLAKQNLTVKFSNVKRNSKGEITAIKTTYKDKNGNSGSSYQKSDEPINAFKIIKDDEEIMIAGTNSSVLQRKSNKSYQTPGTPGHVMSMGNMQEMPVPPTPPAPPAMPNFNATPPPVPNFPTPPNAPTIAYDENSEAWKQFEKQMEKFEEQMKSKEGEMAKFEKQMEEYGKKFEEAFSKDFEKQMEEFEKKMEAFEVEMEAYEKKMQRVVQKE